MNDRIRQIRETLNLSRSGFGKRIGVSGDVVNNLERGRVEAKDYIIKLICAEFRVSETWLRNGNGEMFRQDNESILDRLSSEYKMTERERAVIAAFLKLDENGRAAILQYVDNLVAELYPTISQSADRKTTSHNTRRSPDEMSDNEVRAELERQLAEEKETLDESSDFGHGNSGTATG